MYGNSSVRYAENERDYSVIPSFSGEKLLSTAYRKRWHCVGFFSLFFSVSCGGAVGF